jgi:hypothetical protein
MARQREVLGRTTIAFAEWFADEVEVVADTPPCHRGRSRRGPPPGGVVNHDVVLR